MTQNSTRSYFADYIRVLATLAVIVLHSSGDVLYSFAKENFIFNYWWTANVFDGGTRWCVPIFVMLSGMLLLRPRRTESIKAFLTQRTTRVMIPYFFWCFVYLCYVYRGNIRDWKQPNWAEVWDLFLFKETYYHLWFVPMILGLYFLTPILRVLIKHCTRFEIEYFLTFWMITNIFGSYFPNFFLVRYIGWLAYVGYFILGDYINTYTFDSRTRKWIFIAGLIGQIVTIAGTWQSSAWFGYFSDQFYLYLSVNVTATSIAIFTWGKYYDWNRFVVRFPNLHNAVLYFSEISFGVYLIHVLFLDCFKNAYIFDIKIYYDVFFNHWIHPMFGIPLLALSVTLMSILSISIIKKIPILNKISL